MSQEDNLSAMFGALSDPTRRAILRRLERGELTIGEITEPLHIQLPAVLKHLGILQAVGLVRRRKDGRTVHVSLNPAPLKAAVNWLARYENFWAPRLDRLAARAESLEKQSPRTKT